MSGTVLALYTHIVVNPHSPVGREKNGANAIYPQQVSGTVLSFVLIHNLIMSLNGLFFFG